MDVGPEQPGQVLLPAEHQAVAPDGSRVRLLGSVRRGSMAHFELAPGEVSRAQRHRTVDEVWYVLQGLGRMWRAQEGAEPTVVELRPGLALTLPVGTSFQFRNDGREPLAAVGVTMPPWPGEDEAVEVPGAWLPRLVEPGPQGPGPGGPHRDTPGPPPLSAAAG